MFFPLFLVTLEGHVADQMHMQNFHPQCPYYVLCMIVALEQKRLTQGLYSFPRP